MLEADNPASPLFMVLLLAALIDLVFIWSGLARAQLPNMRTSFRGAKIGSLFAFISLIFVFIAYYFFVQETELFGTIAFMIGLGLFLGGIVMAERTPD
jgi:hypothetical protein